MRYGGTHQVVELDDGHGDEGDQKMVIKCSNLKKKKEKNKNQDDQGKGIK